MAEMYPPLFCFLWISEFSSRNAPIANVTGPLRVTKHPFAPNENPPRSFSSADDRPSVLSPTGSPAENKFYPSPLIFSLFFLKIKSPVFYSFSSGISLPLSNMSLVRDVFSIPLFGAMTQFLVLLIPFPSTFSPFCFQIEVPTHYLFPFGRVIPTNSFPSFFFLNTEPFFCTHF